MTIFPAMKRLVIAILLLAGASLAEPVACELVDFTYDTTSSEGCRCVAHTVYPSALLDTSSYYHEYKAKSCENATRFHEESYTIQQMGDFRKDSLVGNIIDRVYVPELKKYTTRSKSPYTTHIDFEEPRTKKKLFSRFQLEYGTEDAQYLLGDKK